MTVNVYGTVGNLVITDGRYLPLKASMPFRQNHRPVGRLRRAQTHLLRHK